MESSWLPFAIACGLPYTVSTVEGMMMQSYKRVWYPNVKKAPWNPPGWIFGPVWTVLYGMMGYASYLVWREGQLTDNAGVQEKVQTALIAYSIQMLLNWAWTPLFFQMRLIGLALLDFVLLLIAVTYTIVTFFAVSEYAAYLLLPYMAWGLFAITLNFYIWVNNDAKAFEKRTD